MFMIPSTPIYIDKVSGKVIQLRENLFITAKDVLSTWLDKECFPEGVQDLTLNVSSSKIFSYKIGDMGAWSERVHEQGVCVRRLFLYDHSGLSISTAPQCKWDSSSVGYIGVKADTTEQAEEYLNQVVSVWDDFLQYGNTDALIYPSLEELLAEQDYDDILTVSPSLSTEDKVKEAAQYAGLSEGAEWVPLSEAGSVVLKAIQDVIADKHVDEMSDDEVCGVLATVKGWASLA